MDGAPPHRLRTKGAHSSRSQRGEHTEGYGRTFKRVERDESCDSLSIGRALKHVNSVVSCGHGGLERRDVLREVLGCHHPTESTNELYYRLGHLTR